jgi:hypothetical protein
MFIRLSATQDESGLAQEVWPLSPRPKRGHPLMASRLVLASTVLVIAAFAAGCGEPSREEYARKASEACSQLQEDLPEPGAGRTDDPAEIKRRGDEATRAFGTAVDKIKELDRPGGEAGEQAERFTRAYESFINDGYRPGFLKQQRALATGDRRGFLRAALELLNRVRHNQELKRSAAQLGIKGCAP